MVMGLRTDSGKEIQHMTTKADVNIPIKKFRNKLMNQKTRGPFSTNKREIPI